MIAWMKQHRVVSVAGAVIVATWIICFAVSLWRALCSPGDPMARFGQFGDTFGSINALFTGLALIGLVYTVLQQQKQIQQQEADSKENRQAITREKREQFLTARLNASVALIQTMEAMGNFTLHGDDYARLNGMREIAKLEYRIAILLCEANLGFELGDWDWGLEKRAIRDYLRGHCEELLYRCQLPAGSPLRFYPHPHSREKDNLETLCAVIGHRHPGIARLTKEFSDSLMSLPSSEEAVPHIRRFINETVANL